MDFIEAKFYEKRENSSVKCHLCPVECVIRPDKQGICRIRKNIDGTLYAVGYANSIALSIDPIEKKPLYHFKPGSDIVSIGPNGCNLSCGFCQNWKISQETAPTRNISPEELVKYTRDRHSVGVAYTYTEPLIWYEYILDSARLLKESDFATVIVSNGYINEEPARKLFKYIDAANFDLKSMNPEFYRKTCKGNLDNIQRAIEIANEVGVHVEITNLLIPGHNDSDEEISRLVDWIYGVNPAIVLHFSRYFPNFKFDDIPTPPERLLYAYNTAKKKLRHVYTGNIAGVGDPDSRCLRCGHLLIRRIFYNVENIGLEQNKCASCGAESDIVV